MPSFLFRRVSHALLAFFGVVSIVFVLIRIIGNPAALMLPPGSSQQEIDQLSERLGLNAPLWDQYVSYIGNLLQGDLGTSLWTNQPVLATIGNFFPATLLLAAVTVGVALAIGVLLGAIAATNEDSWADKVITFLSYLWISAPQFWIGLVLISIFSLQFRLLPTSGFASWQSMILPVLTLAYGTVGKIAQTTRMTLKEELAKEYVFTAQARGLSHVRVVWHALRNSLLGVITIAGDEIASLVAGAVAVETVFAWPGIGFLSIQAIQRRDTDLVVGVVIAVAAFVLFLNLVIDILYRFLDPRIEVR